MTPGTDIRGIGTLKSIDEAARQGCREDYSVWDTADSLWRQETQTFNLKDLEDPEKSKEFLENWRIQARWDLAPEEQGTTVLGLHIQYLTQPKPRSSTYQKNVSRWQDFLASIGGMDTRA